MEHPDWVLKHKRKGTELRFIRGTYYLYEVKSRWNPEKKRAQKITGRLLGKITPNGFIPSPKYELSHKPLRPLTVKEYGATYLIFSVIDDVINKLADIFPSCFKELITAASMKVLHHCPAKNMDFFFRCSYLSERYPDVSLSEKRISSLFREIGSMRDSITSFFRSLINKRENDYVLMDATHLFSKSQSIDIARTGYNSKHDFEPQVNLLFIYSVSLTLPVYYRIVPGNLREVKAFTLTLKESGIKDAVLIADKGFYSEANIKRLEEEGLTFIIPLRRRSALINYSPLEKTDKKGMDGYFKYSGRYIWYYSYPLEGGRFVHCFLDERLRIEEQRDYLSRIETHPETHSIEGFYERQHRFGTLAVLTNLRASQEDIYIHYKSRNSIEVMIDAMKNVLEADSSYMRNNMSLEGWMFITYISLICYYRIYRLLIEKHLLSKYSPLDILKYMSEIKKVKINGVWYTSEITTKTQKVIEKLGLHIT